MGDGSTGRYSAVLREQQPAIESAAPPADTRTLAEEAGRVTVAHGRFRLSLPSAVVLAALTCAGGYFASAARRPPDDPSQLLIEFRAEMALAKGERASSERELNSRLETLEAGLSDLKGSIGRLRTRVDELPAAPR